ncbi:hypothetical protein OG978_41935 (plasmid) [Streptomyces sp. NBC_01591]|uniref:hypothetical protein n=1 Tax=Streptomyces sp. NBC_01591 TaxID=2975888 RepID=UPI002DD9C9DE|nr:hypothetical protein [Streptomyces sp. NBC_01591]WSD73770.1 hypothetical protein OG978_41935 [Streptomyces sp. NBC_01591]
MGNATDGDVDELSEGIKTSSSASLSSFPGPGNTSFSDQLFEVIYRLERQGPLLIIVRVVRVKFEPWVSRQVTTIREMFLFSGRQLPAR